MNTFPLSSAQSLCHKMSITVFIFLCLVLTGTKRSLESDQYQTEAELSSKKEDDTGRLSWEKTMKWKYRAYTNYLCDLWFMVWYQSQRASTWRVVKLEMSVHELEINEKNKNKQKKENNFNWGGFCISKSHCLTSKVDDWKKAKSQWNRKRRSSTRPLIKG